MTHIASLAKKGWPDVLVILIFLLISTVYFLTPLSEGLVLGGHDSVAAVGLGQEQREFRATHDGETSRWSNAIFSGMPTYQMAPSYSVTDTVNTLLTVYGLGTSNWFAPISYLFLYLLGFYILLRAFNFKPYLAALGSVIWAFSSYFLIIIAAGHIWKVLTLSLIPPTIAGVVLCYRGKYLWGGAVTALFTAFQVVSNHMQMTYYFLFVMLFLVIGYLVDAVVKKQMGTWLKATGVCLLAGVLGVAANLPNIYHTYQYAKESMRGKSELTSPAKMEGAQKATDGLDRDYITAWSYGIDESLTLLIPDYKGGGSGSLIDKEGIDEMDGYDDFYNSAVQTQQMFQQNGMQAYAPGMNAYWGDQPFTVGPVYIGAFVCFLFILGLFYVRGGVKWALLAATVLSFLFAWGKNLQPVTDFFIDYLPMYSKFRTVSSALVIAEFTMPLLAILCLYEISKDKTLFTLTARKGASWRKKVGLPVALVLTLGFCLLVWLAPSVTGNCISADDAATFAAMRKGGFPLDFVATYQSALSSIHHAIISASALRSAGYILVGIAFLWLYAEGKIKGWLAATALAIVCLVDLWSVDKRYLNNDSFTDPMVQEESFAKSRADEQILQDKSYYRVVNLGTGNPFSETTNATAYYHHNIGGYHAAKLHRYQDLIEHRLSKELSALAAAVTETNGDMSQVNGDSISPTLNMLNTKYLIFGSGDHSQAIENPYANGNAWFVSSLKFVKNADEELASLSHLDTKHEAVADERFQSVLSDAQLGEGTAKITSYDTNELKYEVETPKGGVLVFSEIYYPGWNVMLDGNEVELGRVNYVLRALRVPAGKHQIVMSFRPSSVTTTNAVSYAALAVIVLFFVFAIYRQTKQKAEK